VVIALAGLAVLCMPRLNIDREDADRVKCAGNLRQIGLATRFYYEAHSQMPQRLSALLELDVVPELFVCPVGRQKRLTLDQVRADPRMLDDPTYSSYTYVPLTPEQRTADNVLAFETVEHRGRQGINVLFGDGHVEWIGGKQAVQQLRDDYAAGVRPLRLRPAPPSTRPAVQGRGKPRPYAAP
jgi:prepilin-type processing-associated H-X9-DG protein